MNKFVLSSDESEVLLAFNDSDGLAGLAKKLCLDQTVVSRKLKRIAEKSSALEKVGGRWKLTELGRKLNSLTYDVIHAQKAILEDNLSLRIGCNREFASRILAPALAELSAKLASATLAIKTF